MPENLGGRNPIPIVYEDPIAIVFNKPPGLLVIPAENRKVTTLTDIVNKQYLQRSIQGGGQASARLHPCHRLDRDTSGVILYAKGKRNQKSLMELFNQKKVLKHYTAFVHGRLSRHIGEIRSEIKDYYQNKFAAFSFGKSALTRYKVLEFRKNFSVVDVMPVTGRTNQIRIHFAHIKHPLVGEDRYAFRKDFILKFKRIALHARELQWPNPLSRKDITVTASLPDDMQRFLNTH
ncbi:MAG: RluA family pseudouridine synthase [Candidatus Omnitrophica bacterium]|nr:RluA family pseudouridine synthase [Candidatus Omnitrophota bacterium]